MFVRKGQQDSGMAEAEPIITRAMGVRVPPASRKNKSEWEAERTRSSQESAAAASLPPNVQAPLKEKPVDAPQPHSDEGHQLQDIPKIQGNAKAEGKAESDEKTLESVKITAPGTYELNLPSLFERDELIMAVKEGTYFIDLASVFKKSKKD